MKNLTRLSKKATEFCNLSGYDIQKVKEAMKSSSFSFSRCENKTEMDNNGVDYSYPFVIYNPFNLNIS
jgi:hypothetical protein